MLSPNSKNHQCPQSWCEISKSLLILGRTMENCGRCQYSDWPTVIATSSVICRLGWTLAFLSPWRICQLSSSDLLLGSERDFIILHCPLCLGRKGKAGRDGAHSLWETSQAPAMNQRGKELLGFLLCHLFHKIPSLYPVKKDQLEEMYLIET